MSQPATTPGRDAPMNRAPVIDSNLIADGLLFATPGHRCRYLGTSNRDKPRWLEDNKGGYQRIEDVLQESAQLGQPDDVGVALTGPNCDTSSRDIRKDADDDHNVSLIGTLPEQICTSRHRYPNPRTKTFRMGRRKPAARPSCCRAPWPPRPKKSDLNQRQIHSRRWAANEVGAAVGVGKLLPARIAKSARSLHLSSCDLSSTASGNIPSIRRSPEAGIHRKTIERWIKGSKAGHDGYDVEWQGFTWRFHEDYESAVDEAMRNSRLVKGHWATKVLTARPVIFKTIRLSWSSASRPGRLPEG